MEKETQEVRREVHPIFRTMLLDSNNMTKLWFLSEVTSVSNDALPEPNSVLERYMAVKGLWSFFDEEDVLVACSETELAELNLRPDGFPDVAMSIEDRLACKKIFDCKMTAAETLQYKKLVQSVRDAIHQYWKMEPFISLDEDELDLEDEEELALYRAAKSSVWFADPPAKTEEELSYERKCAEEKRRAQREQHIKVSDMDRFKFIFGLSEAYRKAKEGLEEDSIEDIEQLDALIIQAKGMEFDSKHPAEV